MNYLKAEIQKYNRRIARIEDNPDPTKLKCNKLLYEMWRDARIQALKEWEEGRPVCYLGVGPHVRHYRASGFSVQHLPQAADRAGSESARYFAIARNHGFPDNCCDRIQVQIGMALSGDIPPPSYVTTSHGECVPACYGPRWLAAHFRAPLRILCGDTEDTIESLKNLTEQIQEEIELIDNMALPGIRFDEEKLVAYQKNFIAAQKIAHEIRELLKTNPCPMSGKDILRMAGFGMEEDPRFVEYYQMMLEEIKEK